MKIIEVEICDECPYIQAKAKDNIMHLYCRKSNKYICVLLKRTDGNLELPPYEIPDWCELEDKREVV